MEKEFINELERTSKELLKTIDGLTDAQVKYKLNPQVWSIHECLEHIVITEIGIYRILMQHPAADESLPTERVGREKIKEVMSDRNAKVESPESVKPIGRFNSIEELKEKFVSNRERITEALNSKTITFDSAIIVHPTLGEMTKKDWLHFLIHHCERHCQQIEEIKSLVQLQMI